MLDENAHFQFQFESSYGGNPLNMHEIFTSGNQQSIK